MANVKTSNRLVSLDVFRGLTIMSMILVNNPGTWQYVYAPLRHAQWNGWTPTDLIFPFFLFMVGISIKLSMDKYLSSEIIMSKIYLRIVRRTLILFALGMILNGFPDYDLATIRIPGVLQRIAICYFFASIIYIKLARAEGGKVLVSVTPLIIIIASLLVVYYLLMKFMPVPGVGMGRIDLRDGNLAAYVDQHVFGAHVWQYSRPGDPEGLLSTIPAIATTLLGVLCGWWLKTENSKQQKFNGMVLAGIIGVISGYLTNSFFPINKNLWSSSYVLLTAGLALLVFGLIYVYTDILGKKFGTSIFVIFGANAITVYFLSSLFAQIMDEIHLRHSGAIQNLKEFIVQIFYLPVFGNFLGSLLFAISYILLWLLLMNILYQKRIFVKV